MQIKTYPSTTSKSAPPHCKMIMRQRKKTIAAPRNRRTIVPTNNHVRRDYDRGAGAPVGRSLIMRPSQKVGPGCRWQCEPRSVPKASAYHCSIRPIRNFWWLLLGAALFGVWGAAGAVLYVDVNATNPVSPFISWATASQTIQDAIDSAAPGDEIQVAAGDYNSGGRIIHGSQNNRIAVDRAVTIRSVNGPSQTVIRGAVATRCAYLTNGAVLIGFMLTNGATRTSGDAIQERSGGGIWCESTNATIDGCVIAGCVALDYGGGVYRGTLTNCVVRFNKTIGYQGGVSRGGGVCHSVLYNCFVFLNQASSFQPAEGGGVYDAILNNSIILSNSAYNGAGGVSATLNSCTVVGNRGYYSGFAYSTLKNCIIYDNAPPDSGPALNYFASTLSYCCTVPLPTAGVGNITNAPLFVAPTAMDFRLQTNSPCIDAGFNDYAVGDVDLAGNPRIAAGTVDLGAYERQPDPSSPNPPVILLQDGAFGFGPSGFGFNVNGSVSQVVVVEWSSNLKDWSPVVTNTLGAGSFYFSDPDSANFAPRFYRVKAP